MTTMNDRTTPETDDLARGNHVVPTEWAEQLELERDDAIAKLESLEQSIADLSHPNLRMLFQERDEARDIGEKLSKLGLEIMDENRSLKRERDEAREELENLQSLSIHTCGPDCKRPMCVLRRERDEARAQLTAWKEARK